MSDLDTLRASLAQGRGIWIGLFVGREVTHGRYRNADPHVTLAHLGRGGPPDLIDRVDRVLDCERRREKIVVGVHGTARLEQSRESAIVMLLKNSLDDLRTSLLRRLKTEDVKIADTFGWTPHLTLEKISTETTAELHRIVPRSLEFSFSAMTLVVGDERKHYEFQT